MDEDFDFEFDFGDDIFTRTDVYGNYEIENMCYETYPCQHYVTNKQTGERTMMSGNDIFCLLRDNGFNCEHFDEYREYVRRIEHPTEEEMRENERRKKRWEEAIKRQEQERKQEKIELERVTNKYKASSYLDKLKERNNVTR